MSESDYAIDSRGYKFKHGTTSGYITAKCRCDECREHHRVRRMQYRKQKAYGTLPQLYVDAEPIRQHVWKLRNSGMTVKEISTVSGVSITSIMNLTKGRPKSAMRNGLVPLPKQLKKFSKVNADKLFAISPKEKNED